MFGYNEILKNDVRGGVSSTKAGSPTAAAPPCLPPCLPSSSFSSCLLSSSFPPTSFPATLQIQQTVYTSELDTNPYCDDAVGAMDATYYCICNGNKYNVML